MAIGLKPMDRLPNVISPYKWPNIDRPNDNQQKVNLPNDSQPNVNSPNGNTPLVKWVK